MRRFIATIAAAGAASLLLAGGVSADPIAGPTAFEFTATCSGLGSVILTNAGPSHGALLVVGTNTSVLVPEAATPSPALLQKALAAGTTCTFTGGGPPGHIEPFDPFTLPVVLHNG
jgi:hypothetical protein